MGLLGSMSRLVTMAALVGIAGCADRGLTTDPEPLAQLPSPTFNVIFASEGQALAGQPPSDRAIVLRIEYWSANDNCAQLDLHADLDGAEVPIDPVAGVWIHS